MPFRMQILIAFRANQPRRLRGNICNRSGDLPAVSQQRVQIDLVEHGRRQRQEYRQRQQHERIEFFIQCFPAHPKYDAARG